MNTRESLNNSALVLKQISTTLLRHTKRKIGKHIQRECQGQPGLNKSCAKGEDE